MGYVTKADVINAYNQALVSSLVAVLVVFVALVVVFRSCFEDTFSGF